MDSHYEYKRLWYGFIYKMGITILLKQQHYIQTPQVVGHMGLQFNIDSIWTIWEALIHRVCAIWEPLILILTSLCDFLGFPADNVHFIIVPLVHYIIVLRSFTSLFSNPPHHCTDVHIIIPSASTITVHHFLSVLRYMSLFSNYDIKFHSFISLL